MVTNIPLWMGGDVDDGTGYACMGTRSYMGNLISSPYCYEPTTVLKNSLFFEKRVKRE